MLRTVVEILINDIRLELGKACKTCMQDRWVFSDRFFEQACHDYNFNFIQLT